MVVICLCRGRQIALDIVRGLVFMHSKSMIHLDLKSSNGASTPSGQLAKHYRVGWSSQPVKWLILKDVIRGSRLV